MLGHRVTTASHRKGDDMEDSEVESFVIGLCLELQSGN